MKICRLAKLLGQRCHDGYSVQVQCEVDGVIRCLKECVRSCGNYRAAEDLTPPVRKVSKSNPSFATYKGSTTYKGGCAGCGR